MKMHNPPHPGEVLQELCLEPLNLTVTETAKALGVSRKNLSAILIPNPILLMSLRTAVETAATRAKSAFADSENRHTIITRFGIRGCLRSVWRL
jgi:addiction module HigA family antidote